MRNKVLIVMGIIMLVSFLIFGFFAFPVGIPLCGVVGLMYGMKSKDKNFVKWSSWVLLVGAACIVYALFLIKSM